MAAPIHADVVNAIIAPVVEVLQACTRMEAEVFQIQVTSELPPAPDVVVIIELTGSIEGPLICTFTPQVAEQFAGRMLQTDKPPPFGTPDCSDAVAELANMLVSNATGALYDAGYQVELSPPRIEVRPNPEVLRALPERSLHVSVRTPPGVMSMLLGLRSTKLQA